MKLPSDAFEYYFSLGVTKSYRLVAKRYEVSKTTVAKRAKKEGWQRRLEELEARGREGSEKKLVETREEMNARHLKMARAVQGKALEVLKSLSLESAMQAVRALEFAINQERLVRGEPSERTALSIEDTIRREFDRWVEVEDVEVEDVEDDDGK